MMGIAKTSEMMPCFGPQVAYSRSIVLAVLFGLIPQYVETILLFVTLGRIRTVLLFIIYI
jgi:hypothetical protein